MNVYLNFYTKTSSRPLLIGGATLQAANKGGNFSPLITTYKRVGKGPFIRVWSEPLTTFSSFHLKIYAENTIKANYCVNTKQQQNEPWRTEDKPVSVVAAAVFHDQMISVCISKHEGIAH